MPEPEKISIFSPALKSAQPLACRLLEKAVDWGRVANGYLLTGHALEHKTELVKQLACYLNCANRQTQQIAGSCINQTTAAVPCLNCQWLSQEQHPQALLQLKGEGRSGKVPVESARLLTVELSKTSAYARLVTVPDARESIFHRPAANALLKVIEEPPADVLFFFFADNEEDVLSTIVSRCQVISLCKGSSSAMSGDACESNAKISVFAEALASLPDSKWGKKLKGEHYPQTVEVALSLSRKLQEMLKQYEENMEEHSAYAAVVDAVVSSEHQSMKEDAFSDRARAAYLQRLVALSETSKRHNQHYIKAGNALDNFCLALLDLRQSYLGDATFAKR
jgi:hypothetical protein